MHGSGNSLHGAVLALIVLAALAPCLVALASALLPLIVIGTLAAVLLRLVLFHTRRW